MSALTTLVHLALIVGAVWLAFPTCRAIRRVFGTEPDPVLRSLRATMPKPPPGPIRRTVNTVTGFYTDRLGR